MFEGLLSSVEQDLKMYGSKLDLRQNLPERTYRTEALQLIYAHSPTKHNIFPWNICFFKQLGINQPFLGTSVKSSAISLKRQRASERLLYVIRSALCQRRRVVTKKSCLLFFF